MKWFFAILAAVVLCTSGAAVARAGGAEPGSEVLAELYPEHNGEPVGKIEIEGLKRSRESVVRWMLGAREGQPFDAQAWQTGIEHLYKTESLYELHTTFSQHVVNGRSELWIKLSVVDKWTLFPYVDIEGGGGAVSLSAGLFESNLLGTFSNVYVGGGDINGEFSYEVGFSQKWFLQTPFSAAFELAKRSLPVSFQDAGGTTVSSFTWSRIHQYADLGWQETEFRYWDLGIEAFRDGIAAPNPVTVNFIYRDRPQFRLTPSVKLGKVSHSDYLEQGHELTLGVAEANPFQPALEYHAATVSWKQVFFLPDTRNVAYFVSVGHMSPAPLAYQFRLGGFDSVRGFTMNRVLGFDQGHANLEYRSTLFLYRIPFLDIGRMVMQGCAFTDVGESLNSAGLDPVSGLTTQTGTRTLYSAGLGVRAIFLHFSEATGRIDVARAIYPNEGYNVSFGVGQFF